MIFNMSVYTDMANDAGFRYGTLQNQQLAQMIEEQQHLDAFEPEPEPCPYCNTAGYIRLFKSGPLEVCPQCGGSGAL